MTLTVEAIASGEEIVNQLNAREMRELLLAFDVSTVVREIGAEALLDEIGEDAARSYFRIPETL